MLRMVGWEAKDPFLSDFGFREHEDQGERVSCYGQVVQYLLHIRSGQTISDLEFYHHFPINKEIEIVSSDPLSLKSDRDIYLLFKGNPKSLQFSCQSPLVRSLQMSGSNLVMNLVCGTDDLIAQFRVKQILLP